MTNYTEHSYGGYGWRTIAFSPLLPALTIAPSSAIVCTCASNIALTATSLTLPYTGEVWWTISPTVPGGPTFIGATSYVHRAGSTVHVSPGGIASNFTVSAAPYGVESLGATTSLSTLSAELVDPAAGTDFHILMSTPSMPTVTLSVTVSPPVSNLEVRFSVGSASTGRALEYEDAPPSGYTHPAVINSAWLSTNSWTIDWGTNVYGGHATRVTVSLRDASQLTSSCIYTCDFYIVGDALDSSTRNGYIDSLTSYDSELRTMGKAIALQETGGTHYWSPGGVGTAFHNRYPLKEISGSGGGYGVMQLTDSSFLSRDSIWNWKRNIDTAMSYISNLYAMGYAHLNTHTNSLSNTMYRLEGYSRYNGGEANRYHWWSDGPATNNGVPEGWTKFGYIPCGGGTHAYRDYNNDGINDAFGNPYNIPDGPSGANDCEGRAQRYADQALSLE